MLAAAAPGRHTFRGGGSLRRKLGRPRCPKRLSGYIFTCYNKISLRDLWPKVRCPYARALEIIHFDPEEIFAKVRTLHAQKVRFDLGSIFCDAYLKLDEMDEAPREGDLLIDSDPLAKPPGWWFESPATARLFRLHQRFDPTVLCWLSASEIASRLGVRLPDLGLRLLTVLRRLARWVDEMPPSEERRLWVWPGGAGRQEKGKGAT